MVRIVGLSGSGAVPPLKQARTRGWIFEKARNRQWSRNSRKQTLRDAFLRRSPVVGSCVRIYCGILWHVQNFQLCKSCRFRKMLQNEELLANINLDSSYSQERTMQISLLICSFAHPYILGHGYQHHILGSFFTSKRFVMSLCPAI